MVESIEDESTYVQDNNRMVSVANLLLDMGQEVEKEFQAIKHQYGVMDFNDMEHYAYDILTVNDGAIAKQLQSHFQEIMIDEFQDTSELQNEIITLIASPTNVFRVGDVKQSIYRFRQAKPELMRSLMHNPNNKLITLRHNYRSKKSIVEFTNLLFKKIMNVPGLQDAYSDLDVVSIGSERQEEETIPITFALTKGNKEGKAIYIANTIIRMMQEDPSLSFEHFCILTRGHADKAILRKVFDEANIPYDIDTKEGFFNSEICRTIQSLVTYFLMPEDTVSLLGVLMGPLFHLSNQEIAEVKCNSKDFVKGLKESYPAIFEQLNTFKSIARKEDCFVLLREISIYDSFYYRLTKAQKTNFDYLTSMMIDQKVSTLEQLYTLMKNGQNEKSSEASSNGKGDDVVTVTTIHHSKGLQYPVVFLWSSSSNSFKDSSDYMIFDQNLVM